MHVYIDSPCCKTVDSTCRLVITQHGLSVHRIEVGQSSFTIVLVQMTKHLTIYKVHVHVQTTCTLDH